MTLDEWLDIVDEQDRVIGRDTRPAVHAGGHFHRSSHILLFNTAGQVFVQLRSLNKDTNPGLWDTSAAGHVDSGESYLQCAVRELEEELGIVVEGADLKPLGKLQPERMNGFEFISIFSVRSDQKPILQADEIDDGRWLTPADLSLWIENRKDLFTDVFKTIWHLQVQTAA